MIRIVRQVIRGCGTLPHVGEHPGTLWTFAFILTGALAGGKGGFWGLFVGACVMAIFMIPLYLCSAYQRAQLSDTLNKEKQWLG